MAALIKFIQFLVFRMLRQKHTYYYRDANNQTKTIVK